MLHIRPARPDDADWVRGLIPRLHEFGPPRYRSVDAMNAAEADATVAAIAANRDNAVFVAEDDGVKVGFVHLETAVDFFTRERHGHISTIVVAAGAERRGAGRALLTAADEWTRQQGYRVLTLNVFDGNAAARRLYERAGFAVDTLRYLKVIT